MYLGRLVEEADRATLYVRPAHPHTHSLLSAVPEPDPSARTDRAGGGFAEPGAAAGGVCVSSAVSVGGGGWPGAGAGI